MSSEPASPSRFPGHRLSESANDKHHAAFAAVPHESLKKTFHELNKENGTENHHHHHHRHHHESKHPPPPQEHKQDFLEAEEQEEFAASYSMVQHGSGQAHAHHPHRPWVEHMVKVADACNQLVRRQACNLCHVYADRQVEFEEQFERQQPQPGATNCSSPTERAWMNLQHHHPASTTSTTMMEVELYRQFLFDEASVGNGMDLLSEPPTPATTATIPGQEEEAKTNNRMTMASSHNQPALFSTESFLAVDAAVAHAQAEPDGPSLPVEALRSD